MKTLFQIVRSNEKQYNRNALTVLQMSYGKYIIEATKASKDYLVAKLNAVEDMMCEAVATTPATDIDSQFTLRAVKAATSFGKDVVTGLSNIAVDLWEHSMLEHAAQIQKAAEEGQPLLAYSLRKADPEKVKEFKDFVEKSLG